MKNLRTPVICACLTLVSFYAAAQNQKVPVNEPDYNKPRLFRDLPEKIVINPENFSGLLAKQTGVTVNTNLADDSSVPFEGRVVSTAVKYEGRIQSVVIQSSNLNGATLTLSKITHEDGSITYAGRLMSFRHGDLYVLQPENGHFVLVKKNFNDLVNE